MEVKMSEKKNWCEFGSDVHEDCPKGYVYLTSVFEVDDAYDLGYETAVVRFRVYDKEGDLLPEQKAVFVTKEEWEAKASKT
jgi:hypothetical protein